MIVIGAGPAGEVAAGRLAERGRQVAIVEQELVGGECSFYACMPSKALLRPADVLREVARVPGAAEAVSGELDVAAVLARRDEVVHGLDDHAQLPWLEQRGVELVRGQARVSGERRVTVGEHTLTAREAVVIATGSAAAFPPIPGLADAHAWSNREITTARSAPASLIVIGGGVVGVEMAQAWASLGSRVVVLEAVEHLIAGEEPTAGSELRVALEQDGVEVRTGVRVVEVARDGADLRVRLEDGSTHAAERLLVAAGRTPRTAGLGLDSIGLQDGGFVEVDDHMRSPSLPWLYAVGDANGRALLTHAGKYQARIAADNILGAPARASGDGARSPRVIFTDPQIAAVGFTLAAALEAGIDAVAIDLQTSASAGASFYGRGTPGTSRFVVDRATDTLVGATLVGFGVAEMLHAATIAVVGAVSLQTIAHAVAPFPTRTELWLYLLEAYESRVGRSLHASPAPD